MVQNSEFMKGFHRRPKPIPLDGRNRYSGIDMRRIVVTRQERVETCTQGQYSMSQYQMVRLWCKDNADH